MSTGISRPSTAAPLAGEGCALIALGRVCAEPAGIALLRKQPGRSQLAPNILKHSDEQTVVGLAAVFQAMASARLAGVEFASWGIVASPFHMGRQETLAVLERTAQKGVGGASPMIIPHRSLHSVSGTISLAMGCRGPNIGVGGGPGHLSEGLLTALSLMRDHRLPGMWLVLTAWDEDPGIGATPETAHCQALALALVADQDQEEGVRLRLLATAGPVIPLEETVTEPVLADLAEMLSRLSGSDRSARWVFPFEWGGGVEMLRKTEALPAAA